MQLTPELQTYLDFLLGVEDIEFIPTLQITFSTRGNISMPNLYDGMLGAVVCSDPATLKSLFERNKLLNFLNAKKKKEHAGRLLHTAVVYGDVNIIAVLLDKGADVDTQDKAGMTALHQAALEKQTEIASFLLKQGADANSTDNEGRTPLHLAARQGYERIVEQLLKRGADINMPDKEGNTPLHLAAYQDPYRGRDGTADPVQSTVPVIEILLKRGADTTKLNMYGQTPLQLAGLNSDEGRLLSKSNAPSFKH